MQTKYKKHVYRNLQLVRKAVFLGHSETIPNCLSYQESSEGAISGRPNIWEVPPPPSKRGIKLELSSVNLLDIEHNQKMKGSWSGEKPRKTRLGEVLRGESELNFENFTLSSNL
jgi:hypothetical protein